MMVMVVLLRGGRQWGRGQVLHLGRMVGVVMVGWRMGMNSRVGRGRAATTVRHEEL